MKRLVQLARTSALRLALRHALAQVLLLAAALAALLWTIDRYVARQVSASLAAEVAALKSLPPAMLAARLDALANAPGPARGARHYLLQDARGARLAGDVLAWPGWLPADGNERRGTLPVLEADGGAPYPAHHDDHDGGAMPAVGVALTDGGRLLVAQEPGEAEDLREATLAAAGGVLLGAASLALALGLVLGWQWLRRIERINATAGRIAAGDLAQRVPTDGRGDEFDLLAGHLNTMLERIEAAVSGMREVSDNVAHDLRRPLARLKTRIEVVLRQPRDAALYRDALEETLADADELIRTFDALLSIARLEAGGEALARDTVDLATLAEDVAELYADECEADGRALDRDLADGVTVVGSRALLAQALANLVDNALKYSPAGSPLALRLKAAGGRARLAVVDRGSGIPAADRARLAERFARADAARNQPGSGLGLALVQAIAHAHGGQLELGNAPGGGLAATLVLPQVDKHGAPL